MKKEEQKINFYRKSGLKIKGVSKGKEKINQALTSIKMYS
jgi:hypothetical protein